MVLVLVIDTCTLHLVCACCAYYACTWIKSQSLTLLHHHCIMQCNTQVKDKVLTILSFTSMLIEHSYSRYIYNSTEVSSPFLPLLLSRQQNTITSYQIHHKKKHKTVHSRTPLLWTAFRLLNVSVSAKCPHLRGVVVHCCTSQNWRQYSG